jgi:hypothetical protein
MNKTLIVLLIIIFLFPQPVRADWLLDRSGTLVEIDGAILGDDDRVDEVEDEVENEVENEVEKQRGETRREELKQQQENLANFSKSRPKN